jgi:predicted transcriptional regulator
MDQFSRRERQIMEILYRLGRASVADVLRELPDEPSYSAVRAHLRILEEKGHVQHEEKDLRYVYLPVVTRERARRSALRSMLDTFFGGSAEEMVAALLDRPTKRLSSEELDRMAALIDKARKEGR